MTDPKAPETRKYLFRGGVRETFKRFILHPEMSPEQVALSFTIGFSLAWNPFLGLHTWAILLLCIVFRRLHRPLMLLACYLNNPWTMLPMASASSLVGNLVLGRGWHLNFRSVRWHAIGWRSFFTREGFDGMCTMLKPILAPYLVGGMVLSILALPVGYYCMLYLTRHLRGLRLTLRPPDDREKEFPMDMRYLMRQAQQMQAKMQEAQKNVRAEGTAGGAMVKVTLNGAKELVAISVAKEAMDPEDPSMLEDLILAAFKDAAGKADEAMSKVSGSLGGGLNLPGLGL